MKKLFSTTLLMSLLAFCLNAEADLVNKVCKEDFEALKCQNGTIDKLTHIGDTQLNGTNIKDNVTITGNLKTAGATAGSITVQGNANFASTQVNGPVKVTGNVDAAKSNFNSTTDIIGAVNCTESEFTGATSIVGSVIAKHCHFKDQVGIDGNLIADNLTTDNSLGLATLHSEFTNSNLQSIYVRKYVENLVIKSQQIVLKPGTVVNGNITFETNNGTVILMEGAQLKGRITGGNLSKVKATAP
jgi:hypothetical protein